MTNGPKNVSAASKLMSDLVGQKRPAMTLPRTQQPLSREKLSREMLDFYNNCVGMISSCAGISVALRAPEIRASKDIELITKTANVLNTDLQNFSARLKELGQQQTRLSSIKADDEFHMEILRLGESYTNWSVQFTEVVVPVFQQLTALISAAADEATTTQSVQQE